MEKISRFKKPILLVVLVVIVLYSILAFSNLTTKPYLWLDEGFRMQLSRNFAEFGIPGGQLVPGKIEFTLHNISTGWPVPVQLGTLFKFFGTSFSVGRTFSALYLIGFIIVSFLLSKKLWGERKALWSLLLLTSFSPLYVSGKLILTDLPAMFWLVAGTLTFLSVERPLWKWLLSGACIGIFVATKPTFFLLFLPGLIVVLGYLLLKKKVSFQNMFSFWTPAFLISLPTILFALAPMVLKNDNTELEPFAYYNSYESPCIFCNVWDNLLKFGSDTTLLHLALIIIPILLAAIWYIRKRESNPMIWVFAFYSLGAFLWFLQSPGVYRYLLPAQLVALISLPVALPYFLGKLSDFFSSRGEHFGSLVKFLSWKYLSPLFISILILVQIIQFAFFSSIFKRTGPVEFERYVKENIKEGVSIGIINSSLAPVIVPNENMSQFLRLSERIFEGTNPLTDLNNLPDVLIYEDFHFDKDVEPYLDVIEGNYTNKKVFGRFTILEKKNG